MRLLAGVLALASLLGAADTPPSQTVHIDVIAADTRGRVLDNLKPGDFELRDDGVVQAIENVRFVKPSDEQPRLVALFLDEYHVGADATQRVRDAAARFIDQSLRPTDLLVVMKPLDSILAIRLSTDRTAANVAIQSFEGRRGDYAPRNSYERNFMAGTPARLDNARTQIALSAINALAVHFGSFPDQRKTLVVVSEGVGRVERRRGLEYLPTAETIARSAQRSNVSIYSVNPAAETSEADLMPGLARDTAGQSIVADLASGFRAALEDVSGYYLLTYRAARPDDGKFYAVDVHVKRPNTTVRARKGYFAPSPDDALRAALLAKANEPKPVVPPEPAPHASPLIRPWFGTSRGADGKTRVTFVWEPAGRLTGERVRRVPYRLVLTALAPDDAVLFEGVVMPTGAALLDESPIAPLRATFEAPPGRVRLRMAIQDTAQQALDTDVRTIAIRDMRPGVTISTPEVLRARNAREFRTLDNDLAVPVAAREFSRIERLMVRFRAYGPPDVPVTVTARLLSRMGAMRELAVQPASGSTGISFVDVPLAGLAVGEYLIELSATSAAGEVKDVVDFRVTT